MTKPKPRRTGRITPQGQRSAMLKAWRALTSSRGDDIRRRMSEGAQQTNAAGKGFRKGKA